MNNYTVCQYCGHSNIHKNNLKLHQQGDLCVLNQRVKLRKDDGWAKVAWGVPVVRASGVPVERDIVGIRMNSGQLYYSGVVGNYTHQWVVTFSQWIARMAWEFHYGSRQVSWSAYYNKPPSQNTSPGVKSKAFLSLFLKEMMKLSEDERLVKVTEMTMLGYDEFKKRFFHKAFHSAS